MQELVALAVIVTAYEHAQSRVRRRADATVRRRPGRVDSGDESRPTCLPHRPPFLFVDEILEIVPGQSARGRWRLTGDEWFFAGHFPGRPTLPGVLMCEAIAQVGALAVLRDERFAGKLPLFGGLDSARFRRQVGPGDELILECEMGRLSARAGKGSRAGRCSTARSPRECDLMFVVVDA